MVTHSTFTSLLVVSIVAYLLGLLSATTWVVPKRTAQDHINPLSTISLLSPFPVSASALGDPALRRCSPAPSLTVVMPHFMNLEVALFSLRAMLQRQSQLHCVHYVIVSEEIHVAQRLEVHQKLVDVARTNERHRDGLPEVSPCECGGLGGQETALSQSGEITHVDNLQASGLRTMLRIELDRSINSNGSITAGVQVQHSSSPAMIVSPWISGMVRLDVVDFPMTEVGGSSLGRLHQIVNLIGAMRNAEFMVLVDTDVIVLAEQWDHRVIQQLQRKDPSVVPDSTSSNSTVLAAINPRSGPFTGQAEWNFLAFRYSFYRPFLNSLFTFHDAGQYHDVGHWWSEKAAQADMHQHLWKFVHKPIAGRSPSIVGDAVDPVFALHFFYSSRRYKEKIPQEELKFVCSTEEYDALLQLAMTRPLSLERVKLWTEEWQRHKLNSTIPR